MSKLHKLPTGNLIFKCPGCECHHQVWVASKNDLTGAQWTWNGSFENPTFSPSIFVHPPMPGADGKIHGHICHSFVRDGMIQFLSDCGHELAGKTVPLPEVDW